MTYFTFERHGLGRGQDTFDGDTPVGQVFVRKPWRERLSLNDRPPLYLGKLPSGDWLPGAYLTRHDAAEALRAHNRVQPPDEDAGDVPRDVPA